MVKHEFIIITEDADAARDIAAAADKHEGAIDIDYTVTNHIRKIRKQENE